MLYEIKIHKELMSAILQNILGKHFQKPKIVCTIAYI